ncbi:MAG: SDR family oxidoreductase [Pseudomonadota bacterium]
MNILLLGATGFIGRHAAPALRQAGHHVIGTSRPGLDFGAMTTEAAWLPMLNGVDAVINCVGIIRERAPGDFALLHRDAPRALFCACERAGVRRVIHISALGSAPRAATAYWRSKGEAEQDLLGRALEATVLRPSLVYGADGASSRLFLALATLPLVALPMAHRSRVQPIDVADLAALLVKLVGMTRPPRELAAVGPRALSMAAYLAALRRGMDAGPAVVCELPLPLARVAAGMAALHRASPLTPDALTMLAHSADDANPADPAPVAALLGRAARDPDRFTRPADKAAAVLAWGAPLCRIAIALLWLITAVVSWFGWPHAQSAAWLAACGVPPAWREAALLGASVFDATVGLALLLRPRSWLWPLQIAAVIGYTAIMSLRLAEFWLHPFGPLSKNLPLLALMIVMWRLNLRKH